MCSIECVDEAQKCQDSGENEDVCHNKFINCKDKCEQGKGFNALVDSDRFAVENAAAYTSGSCYDGEPFPRNGPRCDWADE